MPTPRQGRTLIAIARAVCPRALSLGVGVLTMLLLSLGSGCTVGQSARRTLIQEPSEFSWRVDRKRSLKVYRQWADNAWAAENGACLDVANVDDYALGFRDGFVDFVYAGGSGEPPPVPPRKFWNIGWRSPAGANAAQQWFAGYRHGALVARDGGYRMNGVVQSAQSGAVPVAWSEAASLGPSPETIAAPPESESVAPESLEYDEQMLPSPPVPAEPRPLEETPAEEQLIDGNPSDSASESAGRDAPGELPVAGAPAASDSTSLPDTTPGAHNASALFRRVISARSTEATSTER